MDLYVLNSDFARIGLVDEYGSIIWNVKYFEIGDFELYLSATSSNISLLKRGNCLVRDKDIIGDELHNVMVIEKIELKTDAEEGDHLIVTGRDLRSIIGRRIVWNQTNLSGKVEMELRRLLTENVISPTDAARKIEKVTLGELRGFSETMEQQVTYTNLSEYIVGVLTTYGIGWRCIVTADKQIRIDFYKGADRSEAQEENPHIIFSPDNENILNSDYYEDYAQYKNVALVAGEGEGTARKRTTVGADSEGLDRYELCVDARDTSSNDGEISEQEYQKLLELNGLEKLEQSKQVESFSGEIEPNGMYVYGEDYDLGDIVTVSNLYGMSANPRIIGVIESYSDEGESVIPSFNSWTE